MHCAVDPSHQVTQNHRTGAWCVGCYFFDGIPKRRICSIGRRAERATR